MESVFFCGKCRKFFYEDHEKLSVVCVHCGSQATINCELTKEKYQAYNEDLKNRFKISIRNLYPDPDAITKQYDHLKNQRHRDKVIGKLFSIEGIRGRVLTVCKNKCIIKTLVTVGSVMTSNATDGEKLIFYKDCTGLQFKESGLTIGYLQFETPSMQMNNKDSNFFSENTFTFGNDVNKVTNEMMREVFYYIMELIENQKYGVNTDTVPEYPALLAQYLKEN